MQQLTPLAVALALLASLAAARPGPEAPYPASGWRPEGRQFFLPEPSSSRSAGLYAPPPPPPPQQYGPPAATTEAAEPTTTEAATTTTTTTTADADAAGAQSAAQREPLEDSEAGVYFVLLPDGRLQRVAYAHGPAPASFSLLPERLTATAGPAPVDAGYLASFHYQHLLPHGAPIYAYQQAGLTRIA